MSKDATDNLSSIEKLEQCRKEIKRAVIGQHLFITQTLLAVLARGHILIEGVPGIAKTLAAKSIAKILGLEFKRIQFTPDLLPADLTGTLIFQPKEGLFIPKRGPVFTQILLADEINRAPAKVQSALLEAMEEQQVTLGEESSPLPSPFLVLATQNPIEHEGTYRLPEAQVDRFLMKLTPSYPTAEEEVAILSPKSEWSSLNRLFTPNEILSLQDTCRNIHIDDLLKRYIVDIVAATRKEGGSRQEISQYIDLGISPRGSLALASVAKATALFAGRDYVLPEDIKEAAIPTLSHRLLLSYEAEEDSFSQVDIVKFLLENIKIP